MLEPQKFLGFHWLEHKLLALIKHRRDYPSISFLGANALAYFGHQIEKKRNLFSQQTATRSIPSKRFVFLFNFFQILSMTSNAILVQYLLVGSGRISCQDIDELISWTALAVTKNPWTVVAITKSPWNYSDCH